MTDRSSFPRMPEALDPPGEPTTVLQRQLRAPPEARDGKILDALASARRRFLTGDRVDVGTLAEALGVNRVTLYR